MTEFMDDDKSLASLLNMKKNLLPKATNIAAVVPSENLSSESNGNHWTRHFDPTTQLFYYHDNITQSTQWGKPDGYMDNEDHGLVDSLRSVATFNSKTGAISGIGSSTYFEKHGRQTDREGRQLSAFFDVTSFEENRAEAAEKKRKLQQSGIDWYCIYLLYLILS